GWLDRMFDKMHGGYAWSLRYVIRYRFAMIIVFVGVLWATVKMFGIVPKGFIPDTDNDTLNVNIQTAQGTSFYETVGYTQRIIDVIKENPYIDAQMVNTSTTQTRFTLQLTPRATRPFSAQQIAQQLRGPLGRFAGFRTFVNVPASLQIGGFQGNS